jgi:trimeric autotransporter adhesin
LQRLVREILLLHLGASLFATGVHAQDAQPPALAQSAAAAAPPAAATPSYEISGSARSGKAPLPGVTVTASNTLTGKKHVVATNLEGKFDLPSMARGRYVVRIEFMGFALFTQEVVLNPENPSAKVDAEMILASRQQQQSNSDTAAMAAAGRGFQSLALDNALSSLASGSVGPDAETGAAGGSSGNGDLSTLPMNGAGADAPTESISISGAQGRTQDFGGGSEEELQERIQEFRERMQRDGGFGGGQGPGGGGAGGGGGGIAIGRLPGGGFNVNKPHGVLYFADDNAGLDARS